MNESTAGESPEADAIPLRTCLAIVALAIVVGIAAVVWSWRMAAERVARGTTLIIPPQVAGIRETLSGQNESARSPAGRHQMVLDRYAWADRERGTVRVPIEVAMTLYLEDRKQR